MYPIDVPTRFPYWNIPHNLYLNPPGEIKKRKRKKKFQEFDVLKRKRKLPIRRTTSKEKGEMRNWVWEIWRWNYTQVTLNGLHVSVVSSTSIWFRKSIKIGEQKRSVQSYHRKQNESCDTRNPSQLSNCPRQRQHSGPDNRRYDMCTCSHPVSFKKKKNQNFHFF